MSYENYYCIIIIMIIILIFLLLLLLLVVILSLLSFFCVIITRSSLLIFLLLLLYVMFLQSNSIYWQARTLAFRKGIYIRFSILLFLSSSKVYFPTNKKEECLLKIRCIISFRRASRIITLWRPLSTSGLLFLSWYLQYISLPVLVFVYLFFVEIDFFIYYIIRTTDNVSTK